MKPEYESYLLKKFPKLYTGVDINNKDAKHPFELFGFECGDGWFRLILWLSRYLQDYIDKQNSWAEKYPDTHQKVDQVVVAQVKEKFGTLRFYTDGGNERTQSVISFAEYLSGYICETTGHTDDVGYNKKGWIKTHHKSLAKGKDFTFVDDKELRQLLSGQLEFNLDSKKDN
jgi:hypothetical protein